MTKPTITGVIPLRNAVKLEYPFQLAIKSLQLLCDEVVVLVDPTSEDSTLDQVRALRPHKLVESVWDMSNHKGFGSSEIAKQTAIACANATGDWIFSLQADEVLHEYDIVPLREAVAKSKAYTAMSLTRLYFYGSLEKYRDNWTVPCLRLFKRGCWEPDRYSGAMQFVPSREGEQSCEIAPRIYHYSRVGSPEAIARRVRNLDTFYHDPANVKTEEEVGSYRFDELRKLDTYVVDHKTEADESATLLPFSLADHPAAVLEYYLGDKSNE